METINQEIKQIFLRFFDEIPVEVQTIDASRSEADFREVLLVTFDSGEMGVLKLSDNDFTFPDKITMWQRWIDNRNELEPIYRTLPTSVFQADLNPTNILLDESGNFVGAFDFNLCGKDVLLNYLFRENFHNDFSVELEMIFQALRIVREYYSFSDLEKSVALPLYRCLKPLWYTRMEQLKEAGTDMDAVRTLLDEIKLYQTKEIVFPI